MNKKKKKVKTMVSKRGIKIKLSTFFILLLLLLFSSHIRAQEEKKLTRVQLIEDTRQLVSTLESTHPDPYINGGGKIAFHHRLHKVIRSIPEEGMTSGEFFRLLSPFITAIQDIHTSICMPSSSEKSPVGLPLGFKVVKNQIYVARVYLKEHRPLLGAILASVQDINFPELVKRQKRLKACENNEYENLNHLQYTLGRKRSLVELIPECQGKDRISVIFRMPDGKFYDIKFTFPEKLQTKSITPPSKIKLPDFEKSDPIYGFLDSTKKTAILRFGNMMGYREAMEYMASRGDKLTEAWANYNYKRFNKKSPPKDLSQTIAGIPSATGIFKSLVSEMKKAGTETLLIDIRDNPGGSSLVSDILMYFLYGWKVHESICDDITTVKYSDLYFFKNKKATIEAISETYTFPLLDSDYKFQEFIFEDKEDQKQLDKYPTFAAEKRSGIYDRFYLPENVIVLTTSGTMSSAYWLAADFYKAGAILVGTPSGQAGNCFGDYLTFTLKNSGLSCGVSYKQFLKFPRDPEKGRVLRPHYELTYEKLTSYNFDPNTEILLALEIVKKQD